VQTETGSALTGLALVTGLNAAALNYVTLNSGNSAPTTALCNQNGTCSTAGWIWHDTGANELKVRNQADGAWIRFLDIDETNGVATPAIPVIAGSSAVSASASEHYGEFVATAAQSFTLAQTSTLWNGFALSIFAEGGNATVSVNAADAINNGVAGTGATIPRGYVGEFRTDGAGNWYLHLQPSVLGTGTIASAATTDLCSVANPFVTISGTTTISSFGSSCQAGQSKIVKFAGALTLTYNATSLILPSAANIAAAAGDTAIVVALGASNYIVVSYQPASGAAVAGGSTPPIVGLARSVSLSMSAALSSGTFKATQIVVSNGLSAGAPSALLPNFSQTLNVSTTGAGGMDTGTPPASGYLDVYAIYNPSGPTASILGCADATCAGTQVYSGANMPAGYSESALLGIVPTDAVKDIQAGGVLNDKFCYKGFINIFTGQAAQATVKQQSISVAVPPSATAYSGLLGSTSTSAGSWTMGLAGDAAGTGGQEVHMSNSAGATGSGIVDVNFAFAQSFADVPIYTTQSTFWMGNQNSGLRFDVTCYRIKGVS
jgi:hypothetical protein